MFLTMKGGKKKKTGLESLFLNGRRYASTGELSSHSVTIQPSAGVVLIRDATSKGRAGLLALRWRMTVRATHACAGSETVVMQTFPDVGSLHCPFYYFPLRLRTFSLMLT